MALPTRPPFGNAQEVFWDAPQNEVVGLSTVDKPTDRAAGTRYFEWDTGRSWIFDGTQWRALGGQPTSPGDAPPTRIQLLILRELRRVAALFAQNIGVSPATFEPLPELDGLFM